MKFIRCFHPIGQGAFYTERHINVNAEEFTVVYDCGSSTFRGKKLETKITSTFPKNHVIDILFISHFHNDHINGIEYLKKHFKIKKVIMPLVNQKAKNLLKISNYIDFNISDTQLIENPTEYFNEETTIIFIDEADTADLDTDIESSEEINITEIKESKTYESGTTFITGIEKYDWLYIPFNYEFTLRSKQFITALKAENLTIDELDTIEKIASHKSKIIKAYKNVSGDLNQNSLVLYSGKKAEFDIYCHNHCCIPWLKTIESGCLYLGDIDLNQPKIVQSIQYRLRSIYNYIGTIQIPHHGAVNNFNISILAKSIRCGILSYGTTNSYGHPSDRVISELISKGINPHRINENLNSLVTQWT